MSKLQHTGKGQKLAELLKQQGIRHEAVLRVIASTPRELFVEPILTHKAYENTALPIGQGQTISQPYIVARMSELLLANSACQKVLEIGTGSGYQAAILAQLVPHLFTVERIKALQWQAKRRLQQLDLHNVAMKHGDGWQGWQAKGPYDAIIVTAAAATVPQELLTQLQDGGCLLLPVGQERQALQLIKRQGQQFVTRTVEEVRFVPLVAGDIV